MSATRRLVAILAVDVVGYSRLMGEAKAGTARTVRPEIISLPSRTAAFPPNCDVHRGGPEWPRNVVSIRQLRANSGHSATVWRIGQMTQAAIRTGSRSGEAAGLLFSDQSRKTDLH
jgi:hypothetical protein